MRLNSGAPTHPGNRWRKCEGAEEVETVKRDGSLWGCLEGVKMKGMSKRPTRPRKTRLFEVVVTFCPKSPGPYKYAVEVPALPGCFSDGRTREEALRNVKEAITLHLSAREERRDTHFVEIPI